ncbi:MAG: hypothetical protein EBR82_35160 [Caulobacteraceae bacterium]|nr:hypothetical protein [Caulobacteraceae bacterium]
MGRPKTTTVSTRTPEFLLRLEVFELIREPGRCYTLREIAAATGVQHGTLHWIEQRAMEKLSREARRRGLTGWMNLHDSD